MRVEGKVRLSNNHSYHLRMNLSFLARKAMREVKQKIKISTNGRANESDVVCKY